LDIPFTGGTLRRFPRRKKEAMLKGMDLPRDHVVGIVDLPDEGLVPVVPKPEDIKIVVAGGRGPGTGFLRGKTSPVRERGMKNLVTRWAFVLLVMVSAILVPSFWLSAEEFPHLTAEALKKMIENGDQSILVVDTQPKGAYDLGHVKGAINFPWATDLKSHRNLPKDKTLILYCDCAHEEDSADVARQLKDKWGYTNIKLLEGGWSNWQKLGYPIDKK